MADTDQKTTTAAHVFDFIERNLPEQETDDESEQLSVLEFIFWMIGIIGGFFFIQYLYRLLF